MIVCKLLLGIYIDETSNWFMLIISFGGGGIEIPFPGNGGKVIFCGEGRIFIASPIGGGDGGGEITFENGGINELILGGGKLELRG
jgi:hypothetical protein